MAKKKFLDRMKSALHLASEQKDSSESTEPFVEERSVDDTGEPIAQYHETLYASDSPEFKKQSDLHSPVRPIYRDMSSIEKNIDSLSLRRKTSSESAIGKKVDDVLSTKKPTVKRKMANVVYVVSKPQPGQVKGDWAVRSHTKIFSHHRTKKAAINNARKVAADRDATVLVQNTDGTFSAGFKPRKKKNSK